jgi:hypothetical protein
MNQDNGSDFVREAGIPVHLAPALKHLVRAMDNPASLKSISFADELIDDIDFNGLVAFYVLNRLW